MAGGAWITEGNYAAATFGLRMPCADLVLWIEQPRWLSLWRVTRRTLVSHVASHGDLAAGSPSRFDARYVAMLKFIRGFDRRNRPLIEGLLAEYPDVPVMHLKGDREMAAYLAAL